MSSDVLDRASALHRMDGDEHLYEEIVSIFLADAPSQIDKLKIALAAEDRIVGERHAHSLKSAAANIGANTLRDACAAAEKDFAKANMIVIMKYVERIEAEFVKVKQQLESIQ